MKNDKNKLIIKIILCVLIIGGLAFSLYNFNQDRTENKQNEVGKVDQNMKLQKLYIYKGDDNAEYLQILKTLYLEEDKTTADKIERLREELQKTTFEAIDIQVQGYKQQDDKNILVVNLQDRDRTVFSYLDAGSAGGRIYLGILVNSFLQNEIELEGWVDGLQILINGEEGVEGNHFNLMDNFYRTDKRNIIL